MVRFDNETEDIQQSSHAIRLVAATVALSPGDKAALGTQATDDDNGDDDDSKSGGSDSDSQTSSESEEESPGQNVHAERRKKYREDYKKLVGSEIKVCSCSFSFLFIF
jgi:hypothetical protein